MQTPTPPSARKPSVDRGNAAESESRRRRDGEDLSDEPIEGEVQNDAVIAVALRRSAIAIGILVALAVAGYLILGRARLESAGPDLEASAPREVIAPKDVRPPSVVFSDITAEAGITFVHENGATGDRFLPETMGSGAAFFDFDADGDQDLFLVNAKAWRPGSGSPSALYENDGRGSFRDVTAATGTDLSVYGTGVAVGDFNNDGYPDLFVAAVGSNVLLENTAAGANKREFRDVTRQAGVAGEATEWSTSSAFFDYDRDGDLDLFVGNYVRWSQEIDLEVGYTLTGVGRAYGPPLNYEGTFPYLYRNDGGAGPARFTDVSRESGVRVTNAATGGPVAKSLGVVVVDADQDGAVDVLVANDTVRNFFLRNRGDGTFEEVGELFGVAYGRDGSATGAMGVDVADYRNDGSLAFAIGNFANEMTSLYVSQGDGTLYADEAIGEGIGAASRRALTFGINFLDYDLDGRLDLLQVNGHLEAEIGQVDPSQEYRQRAQLFWNAGGAGSRTWLEVDAETAGDLALPIVGRGSASADIDGDGDLDLLLLQTGARPLLLRNDQALGHHWLRLRLVGNGTSSNRDAIGAWIELVADGVRQRRQVAPSRSYQSSSELVSTFGLGTADSIEELVVVWPDGSRQVTGEPTLLAVDSLTTVRQDASVR